MQIAIIALLLFPTVGSQEEGDQSFERKLKILQAGTAEEQAEVLTKIYVDHLLEKPQHDRAIGAIRPLLGSSSADVRMMAAAAYIGVGGKPKDVLPLCRDENSDVRSAAGQAFLDGGGEPRTVRFMLRDSSPGVRGYVVRFFLSAGGDTQVALPLLEDESASVRRWAGYCLIERGVIEPTLPLLDDNDSDVRNEIIRGLLEQGADSRYLRKALKSGYPDTRNAAAAQLLSHREIPFVHALAHFMQVREDNYSGLVASLDDQQRKDVQPTLDYWLKLDDAELRSTVKSILLSWGVAPVTAKEIREQLADPAPRTRIRALTALSKQATDLKPFLLAIKEAMAKDKTGRFLATAASIAKEQKRTEMLPLLRPFMSRSWPEEDSDLIRISIASAVGHLQPSDTESTDLLGELLESPAEDIPIEAVRALWRMDLGPARTLRLADRLKNPIAGDWRSSFVLSARQVLAQGGEAVIPTLIEWLEEDDSKLHAAVLDILWTQLRRYSPTEDEIAANQRLLKSVLPHAARLLESDDENVRKRCFQLLLFAPKHHQIKMVGNPKLRSSSVEKLARSPTDVTRRNLAELLGRYETVPAKDRRPLLEKLRKDSVPIVQTVACLALARLAGTNRQELARELLGILNGDDTDARELVAKQLPDTRLNLKPVLPQLFVTMERGKVLGIPKLLATVGDDAVAGLLDRLEHQKSFVREEAARALGTIGRAEFVKPMMKLLKAENTTRGGLQGLLKFKPGSYPPELAEDLLRIISTDFDPDEDPLALTSPDPDHKLAIQLLGRMETAGSSAVALLARQKYELTESYTLGTADVVPELSVLMAVALVRIEPKQKVGLMGFRKILTGVMTGRTWLYHRDDFDDSGYEMAIDAIVEFNSRCHPLIPKLTEIAEPPGQLIHPGYRSLAAYALSKLQPTKAAYWTRLGKRLRDRLPKHDPARLPINERFDFE